jgi:hypothetical protein
MQSCILLRNFSGTERTLRLLNGDPELNNSLMSLLILRADGRMTKKY